ncbi:MAG: ABC transporter permease [Bacteroidales bacterium]|nr:ABC transporter permease [Bacteroidales bacterium]
MNFPFYISKRYLFSKKKINIINIISIVSVMGVAVGSMALIIVLSVFNGFDGLIKSLFSSFDPDLKITVTQGKTFSIDSVSLNKIKNIEGVAFYTEIIEENSLLKYGKKLYPAVLKGVDDNYTKVSGVDTMITQGKFLVKLKERNFAVVGQGVAYYLSLGLNFVDPIQIFVPRRTAKSTLNPNNAFNKDYIYPTGFFSIQQDIDSKFIIVPIRFARKMLEYNDKEVSAVELKLKQNSDSEDVKNEISEILGANFTIKNRYEQHELLYKMMKSEKLVIYLILSFILIIASFNIIASLTMLIIDKKNDLTTLRSMGLDLKAIRKIFFFEGIMISLIGAITGVIIGFIFCWLQQKYGFIKLQGGSFIISSYPVKMIFLDFINTILIVFLIGSFASFYPVRYITKKYLT